MTPDETALLHRLRADLQGFTVDAVQDLLGPVAHDALGREQPVAARLVASGQPDDPVATLLATFLLGMPVSRRRLAAALPSLGVTGAQELGLVVGDEEVRAVVELRPHAAVDDLGPVDRWILSDLGDPRTGAPTRADHVLGVGGASLTLAHCTVRTPVERVLDLGTGCGVQALYAARHARHVTATDTSARALRFAGTAWALNGVDVPLDLRRGDLLEPVAGERFDLVVSNPPFVITPRAAGAVAFEYRDVGLVGDALVERLVRSVGALLRPGGIAQLLGNWEHRHGQEWTERVGGWLGDDVDAWVIQRELLDPAQYAELWMRDAGQHLGPDADALTAAWLADFADRGVDAVGFGLVTLRRPVGDVSLRRLEERHDAPSLPGGHEIAAFLAAHDLLAARDDDALLAGRFTVAPDVTEERHHRPGEADPFLLLLRRPSGAVQASTALAGFVGACDGELTAAQIVGALAHLLEVSVADLGAELVPSLRRLVQDAYLTDPT